MESHIESKILSNFGIPEESVVPGSVKIYFENGMTKIEFSQKWIVPPELMAKAFSSLTQVPEEAQQPPAEETPEG